MVSLRDKVDVELENVSTVLDELEKDTLLKSFKVEDNASLLASSSSLCFVIIPFTTKYDLVYRQLIKPAAETSGLKALRADEMYLPGVITAQIRAAIHQSIICVADVTDTNPNIFYEVGIAHTLGKPTILLSQNVETIPFDLSALRVVPYDMDKMQRARENLVDTIKEILGKERLVKAEELLQQGNARAAIIETSIYFEHALRELIHRNEASITDLLHGRMPERLSMGQMLKYLSKLDVVSRDDVPKIRECIDLRNRTVHDLAEPKIAGAKSFTEVASDFVQKYLGEYFDGR